MITRKRLAAGVCALLAALTAGIAFPAAAAADETTRHSAPKVELVLDVSGSMRARDIDGQSRMAAAKQAFNEVLDATPEEVQLGIRTLGADYRGDDRKTGCKDTAQLYPVGPLDRTEAKTAVATLTPTGWTPIGPALLKAADDLHGGEGSARIVLISDGEDTCRPARPVRGGPRDRRQGHRPHHRHARPGPERQDCASSSAASPRRPAAPTPRCEHTDELTDRVNQLVDRAADPVVKPVAVEGASACTGGARRSSPVCTPTARSSGSSAGTGWTSSPAGAARLGERRRRPRPSTPTTGCCCGRSPCTAGRSCAARRRATAAPT